MAVGERVELVLALKNRLSGQYRRVANDIDGRNAKVKNSLKQMQNQSDRTFKSMKQSLISTKTAFVGLATYLSSRVIKTFIDTERRFRGAMNALTVGTGSIREATKEFDFLRNEARRLGLDLETTAASYAKFTAATRGTRLEGKATRDIFSAVSEASAALSLSAEQSTGALNALQQMVSKGNVQAEELRGQLGERIPGAFKMAADAMGVTQKELNKLLETGKVTAEDMLPKLAEEMHKTFGEQAAKGATNLNGKINLLSNSLFDLKKKILDAGLREFLINSFDKATSVVKKFSDNLRLVTDNVNVMIEAGKIFFKVWAASKIISITQSISKMNIALASINPTLAALTAGLIAVESASMFFEDRAKKISGQDFVGDLGKLEEIKKGAENIKDLKSEIFELNLELQRVSFFSSEGQSLIKKRSELSKQVYNEQQAINKITGEGYNVDIEKLDLIISQLKKKEELQSIDKKTKPGPGPGPTSTGPGEAPKDRLGAAIFPSEKEFREQIQLRKEYQKRQEEAFYFEKDLAERAAALQQELRLEQFDGRQRELEELKLFEEEKRRILEMAGEETAILEAVARERMEAINQKWDKVESSRSQSVANAQIALQQRKNRALVELASSTVQAFREFAGESKGLFLIEKGIAAAQTIVATQLAAAKALALPPPGAGVGLAAVIQGIGAANLATILGTTIKGFADGGRPPTDRPSIIGERGPELFVPDGAGTIVPNEALTQFAPQINIYGAADPETTAAIVGETVEEQARRFSEQQKNVSELML